MGKVIINISSDGNYLVKRYSDISIVKKTTIELASGKNVLEDLPYGFYFDEHGLSVSSIAFDDYDTSKIVNMHNMFCDCRCLTELDLNCFATSNVIDMGWMFCCCSNINKLDLSCFDTCNVTNMCGMFIGCENLKELDLSSFDTRNVTNVEFMFDECRNLEKLDLSNFDMSNIRAIIGMFSMCKKLRYIRCKKAFKEWCLINKYTISLPLSMYECNYGVWHIID